MWRSMSAEEGQCNRGNARTEHPQLDAKIYKNGELCLHNGGAVDCSSDLVLTSSSPSEKCDGDVTPLHYWPVGDVDACHGWAAIAPNGDDHKNSAKNIRCSEDGSTLLYTQYAGNIDCSAGGVDKTFVFNECHQGVPPNLYDKGLDFGCCGPVVKPTASVGGESHGDDSSAAFINSPITVIVAVMVFSVMKFLFRYRF